jgi:fucose 4-O-acetylase-like acetyltransferase
MADDTVASAGPSTPRAGRRMDIDRAKGLGILLVVFGHIVAKNQPLGNQWYAYAQTALYEFHMPFFLYLSGYVTFLTGAGRVEPARWAPFVRRRAARLLVPFLLFGLVFVLGKLAASHFLYVDNLPGSTTQAFVDLLWNTDSSPAISIWYMFVLFVACIVTPPLMWLTGGRLPLVLLIALVLYLVGAPHRMFADRVAGFYVFFVLGALAADAGAVWLERIDRYASAALAALLVAVLAGLLWQDVFTPLWARLVCGAISMPALHALVRRAPWSRSQALLVLGGYSFVIYLLNTPCIGLTKGVMLKFMPWDGANFLVFAPMLLLAGVAGPMLIKRFVLRPVPVLDRITT